MTLVDAHSLTQYVTSKPKMLTVRCLQLGHPLNKARVTKQTRNSIISLCQEQRRRQPNFRMGMTLAKPRLVRSQTGSSVCAIHVLPVVAQTI
jgi:hypothetical protein